MTVGASSFPKVQCVWLSITPIMLSFWNDFIHGPSTLGVDGVLSFVVLFGSCATTAESLTRHLALTSLSASSVLIFELVYSSSSILFTHMMGESETYETMKKSLPNALLQNML